MDQLLEKLFYFSKLETGNMPLFFERIEWKEYLENFCRKHDVILEKNVLNLKLEDVQQGIYSNIDREQMNRILDNLLENSKKYAEVETVNVIIRTYLKEPYFVLEVSDNGYGVAKDKLNHIFEQFYRGDESRSKKEGNGLGLYIVKYLVEAMGGSVTAENRDGLTVQLSLPIIEKEDESNE
jgi:signal transduction histidine kinase